MNPQIETAYLKAITTLITDAGRRTPRSFSKIATTMTVSAVYEITSTDMTAEEKISILKKLKAMLESENHMRLDAVWDAICVIVRNVGNLER